MRHKSATSRLLLPSRHLGLVHLSVKRHPKPCLALFRLTSRREWWRKVLPSIPSCCLRHTSRRVRGQPDVQHLSMTAPVWREPPAPRPASTPVVRALFRVSVLSLVLRSALSWHRSMPCVGCCVMAGATSLLRAAIAHHATPDLFVDGSRVLLHGVGRNHHARIITRACRWHHWMPVSIVVGLGSTDADA